METKNMVDLVCELRDRATQKEIEILKLQHEVKLMNMDISLLEIDLKLKAYEIEVLGNESLEKDLNEVFMCEVN